MTRILLLDSGVLGLLCISPRTESAKTQLRECQEWLQRLADDSYVRLPEVVDFEVRRELIRLGAHARLQRLDTYGLELGVAPVTRQAWLKAAEFWALVRRAGVPTSSPEALDGDALLAAVAATLGETSGLAVTIATTNVRHLLRFPGVDARPWQTVD